MSWTARITKAPNGELRLQFEQPLRHLDMNRDTARQLAALLVVAAEGKRSEPLESIRTADVQPKTAMNGSQPAFGPPYGTRSKPKTSQTHSDRVVAENKPNGVSHGVVLLALTLLALLVVACGGSADSNACPHRTHQITDAAGNVTVVDNTPAEDAQICDYLAYLAAHVHDGVVDCGARQGVTGGQCGDAGAGGSP